MAQTKTRPKKARAKSRSANRTKASAASRAKASTSKATPSKKASAGRKSKPTRAASRTKAKTSNSTTRAASRTKAKTSNSKTSKPAPSRPQAALDAVEETAKETGGKIADVAGKAKVPLLAGGAALAGAAGGLALGAHQAHRHSGLGGIGTKELAKAARKAGDVGAQVGEIALEVRRARESSNGNGSVHRSPIEVVLQGLTSRHRHG
jgi:hypothetical protein